MPVKSLENSHSLEGKEVTVLVETEEGLKEMKMIAASCSVSLDEEDKKHSSKPLNQTYEGSVTVSSANFEEAWRDYAEKLKRMMLFQKAYLEQLNGGSNPIIEYYQDLLTEERLLRLNSL